MAALMGSLSCNNNVQHFLLQITDASSFIWKDDTAPSTHRISLLQQRWKLGPMIHEDSSFQLLVPRINDAQLQWLHPNSRYLFTRALW